MSPTTLGSATGKIELDASGVIKATSDSERAVRNMQKAMQESSNRIQAAMSLQVQKEQALAKSSEDMGRRVANAWALQEQKARALSDQYNAVADTALKAGAALDAIAAGAGAGIYSVTQLAARYETLGVVTETLGKNVGATEEQVRSLEQALQDEGITMIASRESVAQMIQANIDLSKATELAREAQNAAVIQGIDSSEAFGRIVSVIASGNVLMARRMGLFVDFQKAYESEAKTLDRSTESLTENEKVRIRTDEVLRVGANIAGAYSEAMETAGKKVTSLTRHIQDSKVMLGQYWLPVYADAIDFVTNSLKTWEEMNRAQKDNVASLITYGTTLAAAEGIMLTSVGTVMKLKTAMIGLGESMGVGGLAGLVTTLGPAAIVIGGLAIAVTYATKRNAELGKAAEKATKEAKAQTKAIADTSNTYDEYLEKTKKVLEAQHLNVVETENGIRVYDGTSGVLVDVTSKWNIYTEAVWRAIKAAENATDAHEAWRLAEKEGTVVTDEATAAINAQADAQKKLADSYADAALQAGLSGDLTKGWGDYQKTLKDLQKEHDDLTAELGKTQRAEIGVVAASNYVKEALSGANKQAYQPFLKANKDLVEKHAEIEKQMLKAQRLYGENSDEVQKYTSDLAANERQLVLAARNQDLQKQLDDLKKKGYDPNSKAVQELNQKLAENEQAQKDAAAAASRAIKEFIYEKAALDLPTEAATELAHSMGLLDDDTYNAVLAQQELRKEFEDTGNLEDYIGKTGLLADIIERLKSKSITITMKTIHEEYWIQKAQNAGPGVGVKGTRATANAAGGQVFAGKPFTWNEPGYQGETMVIPTNGYILNRLDSMRAAQNAFAGAVSGQAGGAQVPLPHINFNIYDAAAAKLAFAEVRRMRNERFNASMS